MAMAIPARERELIVAIAREVRKHVRVQAGAYCPPEGLCGEASLAISVRLTRAGIPHEVWGGAWQGPFAVGEGELTPDRDSVRRMHAWVRFPQYDGAILDVTADQFDDHPNIRPIWFPARKDWYEPMEEFDQAVLFEEMEAHVERSLMPMKGPRFRRPQGVRVRAYRRGK